MVRQKYSTGKTAGNATGYVDDADAQPASKLLKIPHDEVLEHNGDNELQQPEMHSQTTYNHHQFINICTNIQLAIKIIQCMAANKVRYDAYKNSLHVLAHNEVLLVHVHRRAGWSQ